MAHRVNDANPRGSTSERFRSSPTKVTKKHHDGSSTLAVSSKNTILHPTSTTSVCPFLQTPGQGLSVRPLIRLPLRWSAEEATNHSTQSNAVRGSRYPRECAAWSRNSFQALGLLAATAALHPELKSNTDTRASVSAFGVVVIRRLALYPGSPLRHPREPESKYPSSPVLSVSGWTRMKRGSPYFRNRHRYRSRGTDDEGNDRLQPDAIGRALRTGTETTGS